MNEEFKGELKKIPPSCLFKEGDDSDKIADFFLTLAVVFNDLKGLITFDKLIREKYRQPQTFECSMHAGEYGGRILQIQKNIIGLIHEFLHFLRDNKNILSSGEFQQILKTVPSEFREQWKEIEDIALGNDASPEASKFKKSLLLIRNNTAYHYKQAGKILREGFITKFFKKKKDPTTDFACYSINDEDVMETGFYYADAAEQEYIFKQARIILAVNDESDMSSFDDYLKVLIGVARTMNFTILRLLKKYLREKSYRK